MASNGIQHLHAHIPLLDIIAVMEAGNIVEQGTHDELIARKDGRYAALVQHQLSKAESSIMT